MPKGTKYFRDGSWNHRFVCPCGYSKIGSDRETKMADKLHTKVCEIAQKCETGNHVSNGVLENGHSGLMKDFDACVGLVYENKLW